MQHHISKINFKKIKIQHLHLLGQSLFDPDVAKLPLADFWISSYVFGFLSVNT